MRKEVWESVATRNCLVRKADDAIMNRSKVAAYTPTDDEQPSGTVHAPPVVKVQNMEPVDP